MTKISRCLAAKDTPLFYTGPDLKEGPLPALFYFALSAEESLGKAPFNEPVSYLAQLPIRIFSMDLPGHGQGLDPLKALNFWAERMHAGENLVALFIEKIVTAVAYLEQLETVSEGKMHIAGLSRGAFMATHAAAHLPQFKSLLGFAPLTTLTFAKEFEQIQGDPLVTSTDLMQLIDKLIARKVRFYIGNHDMRVSTSLCFQFIEALAAKAFEQRIRSPEVELIIGPSIGFLGHGTSSAVFQNGAQWIADQMREEG